jgi:hypothetical protein
VRRTHHHPQAAAERRTHRPEAVAGIPRPQAEVAAVKGVGSPRSAVAAAARPTFISSYALVGDVAPSSKLRNIHACIASEYAVVKTAPTMHANAPNWPTNAAAISIRLAINVLARDSRDLRSTRRPTPA